MVRGSSPLARGLLSRGRGERERPGIIPARAGFTTMTSSICSSLGDHPRSRGVYCRSACQTQTGWGSSPLARGLPVIVAAGAYTGRIIPARAGFTVTSVTSVTSAPDHPRSRGVYVYLTDTLEKGPGSSPLARGLQSRQSRQSRQPRIIPARAGFTAAATSSSARPQDHPRSRGVYQSAWDLWSWRHGSSPLARGLRASLHSGGCTGRIIPARAGFTTCRSPMANL